MVDAKLNPTLFEKLTQGESRVVSILDHGRTDMEEVNARAQQRTPLNIDRYNESAMRASVRRELGWLLNTVRLGAAQDLSRSPQVKTSVLNYGLPDLTGKPSTADAVRTRAREIETAIRAFEPRLDPAKLHVEAKANLGVDNTIAYIIHGDISAAVKAMPVKFFASVEVETGEAVVNE